MDTLSTTMEVVEFIVKDITSSSLNYPPGSNESIADH